MLDTHIPDISLNARFPEMPKVDITPLHLDRTLTEHELFRIAEWAEGVLKNRPNETVELLVGNTTILGVIIDGRKDQEEAEKVPTGSPEWLIRRDIVRGYGKQFSRKLAAHLSGNAESLTTLCYAGLGELVKNTFDHADGSSLCIVITQTSGKNYFIYRDYLKSEKGGMIRRFHDREFMDGRYKMTDDIEIMHHLLSPTKSTRISSGVNCGLGLGMICSGIRGDGTLNITIHTDGYKFDILNPILDFSMSPSTLPSDIWYIATPKT